jgi:glutamyl-tRNA(Gln) amidotransferase subunit E
MFETIVEESRVSPTMVAVFLTETLRALKRDGFPIEKVSELHMREVFKRVGDGKLAKEAVGDVVGWLSRHEGKGVDDAVGDLGLKFLSEDELSKIVDDVMKSNRRLIEEQGANAFGLLMSLVMKDVRGKANAAVVSELIKKKMGAKERRV